MSVEINKSVITKLLSTVDAGLCSGLGQPVPGQMCVEAAVCFSLGLPHSDDPGCVSQALRSLKIKLNDSGWSSNEARAKGFRRLAVAQLGSKGVLNEKEFVDRVVKLVIQKNVAKALRHAAELHTDETHKLAMSQAANRCEREGTKDAALAAANCAARAAADAAAYCAARAANAAAYCAAADDRDNVLAEFAEDVVQILVDMEAPGCKWLAMTEAKGVA